MIVIYNYYFKTNNNDVENSLNLVGPRQNRLVSYFYWITQVYTAFYFLYFSLVIFGCFGSECFNRLLSVFTIGYCILLFMYMIINERLKFKRDSKTKRLGSFWVIVWIIFGSVMYLKYIFGAVYCPFLNLEIQFKNVPLEELNSTLIAVITCYLSTSGIRRLLKSKVNS